MTPLAMQVVRNLTVPVRDRTIVDDGGLIGRMAGIHCFEVTEVAALVSDLARNAWDDARGGAGQVITTLLEKTAFLPASKVWLEWRHPDTDLVTGYLLEERGDGFADVRVCLGGNSEGRKRQVSVAGVLEMPVPATGERLPHDWKMSFSPGWIGMDEEVQLREMTMILAMLALINTPRLIGRRQHMPHRGLERRLIRQRRVVGKFPLHAWTEIRLEVSAPADLSGQPSTEAHLTGMRALHFCRAHLRLQFGRLVIVRGHWRGDAALGIKQSRYRLTASEAA